MSSEFNPLATVYRIQTDDGQEEMTYGDYLDRPELMAAWADRRKNHRMLLGRNVIIIGRERIRKEKRIRVMFDEFREEKERWGLKWFAPSGPAVLGFLNDATHDVKAIRAGNQRGKTVAGIIDDILDMIPCDPTWPIFTDYGVDYRPWRGEIVLSTLTYKLQHQIEVIYKRLLEWMPRDQWPDYQSGRRKPNWDKYPNVKLSCGSVVNFRAYSQSQDVFEGPTWTTVHWDEQGMENLFDAADERVSTQGWTPGHKFTLTPHEVEGRQDTGSGTWIEQMFDGTDTKGKTVSDYEIHPDHVPDFIYPEAEKTAKKRKWITEPLARGDMKTYNEGLSRFYGHWHKSGGLVYDEWRREIHVIDPFEIPEHWTLYRALDHGTRNPTVCLWGAVNPKKELYIYREYFRKGHGIPDNCKEIIERSGNTRVVVSRYQDESGLEFPEYEERQIGEVYENTVLDPRSFKAPDSRTGGDLSSIYEAAGLACRPATAHRAEERCPKVKAWLTVDMDRPHARTGKPGWSQTYVFVDCPKFIFEIEHRGWVRTPSRDPDKTPRESPEKKHDHTQNAFEYLIWADPQYYAPIPLQKVTRRRRAVNVRTGY